MKTLLIIWHSRTGGTHQMIRAAAAAAEGEPAVRVLLRDAGKAQAEDMLTADGVVFAAPENLASMSGVMKDFFDRSYYTLLDRVNGKPYAAMVCAGSDGSGALRQIERIATGLRLRAVSEGVIVNTRAQTPEAILAAKCIDVADLAPCRDLGAAFAAGLSAGIF